MLASSPVSSQPSLFAGLRGACVDVNTPVRKQWGLQDRHLSASSPSGGGWRGNSPDS